MPLTQIDDEMSRLSVKHLDHSLWGTFIDPFGTVLLNQFIGGQLKTRDMLIRMHVIEGRLRLASLLVLISAAWVKNEDIPDFIETAGPDYNNPFTGEPMKWDPDGKRIYFPNGNDPCVVHASFHITYNHTRDLLPMPRQYMQLC